MSYESAPGASPGGVMAWLRARLLQHVHVVRSVDELRRDWLLGSAPSRVSVVVCVDDAATTPLFLAVLAVMLDGRVRLARVARRVAARALARPPPSVLVSSPAARLTYVYGAGDADCLTLPCVRLLLTALAPGAGDLLDVAITLSLLVVALQPVLVCCGGLAARVGSVLRLCGRVCAVLLLYCCFVSYVMPEHELQRLLDDTGVMAVWSWLVLSSFGDHVRSDWLRYTTVNFDGFVVSYMAYLLLVAWFRRRSLCRHKLASMPATLQSTHLELAGGGISSPSLSAPSLPSVPSLLEVAPFPP